MGDGRHGELSGLEELLKAVAEQPDDAFDALDEDVEDETERESASGLLALLIEREWLELSEEGLSPPLVVAVAELLAEPAPPERQAEALLELLVDHDSVEEVYASEEDLESLLAQW